jgi:hypothetical protein
MHEPNQDALPQKTSQRPQRKKNKRIGQVAGPRNHVDREIDQRKELAGVWAKNKGQLSYRSCGALERNWRSVGGFGANQLRLRAKDKD